MHYVYFIRSEKDNSIYVGLTSDLRTRLSEHNLGKTRSTKSKRPYKLIYYEAYIEKQLARKRELHIKKSWSIKEKILTRVAQ